MKTKFLRGKIEVKKNNDVVTVIASDETLDRHGDVLPIEQWDLTKFMLSPRMLIDHNHEVASIVGKWENVRIEGKKLLMDAKFHGITDISKAVEEMVKTGYLDTVSVGFIYHGPEEDGGRDSFELIETSWVTVPANPSARVQTSLKTALEKKTSDEELGKIKEFVGDEEMESSDDILPDDEEPEDVEPEVIPEDDAEVSVKSIAEFKELKEDTEKVLCDYKFVLGLISDSEKLLTLTDEDKARVGEALRSAKIMKFAIKEAVHQLNDSLRKLNKV